MVERADTENAAGNGRPIGGMKRLIRSSLLIDRRSSDPTGPV